MMISILIIIDFDELVVGPWIVSIGSLLQISESETLIFLLSMQSFEQIDAVVCNGS